MRGTPKNAVRFFGAPTRPCLTYPPAARGRRMRRPHGPALPCGCGNLHVKSSELINEAPGGGSSSRGTRRVNLLKPAGGLDRALGEAGPIPSPTRGKLLPPAGSLSLFAPVKPDAQPP